MYLCAFGAAAAGAFAVRPPRPAERDDAGPSPATDRCGRTGVATWAFITWVAYAAYLHARATAGWKTTGTAWINLAGYGCLLFNFVGVHLFITGLHSYAGV